jgi:lysozyme family protein
MTPRFLSFFAWLIPREAVYARGHHGDLAHVISERVDGDNGGLTKWGVDQRSHPSADIEALTLEDARDIYWLEYWVPSMAEQLPAGYGELLADIRVNGGDGPRMLQRALNRFGAGLVVDGRIGPKTVAAAQLAGRGGLKQLFADRDARYRRLARKPKQGKFLEGWLNRNNSLREFVGLPTVAVS